jgi:hypothetical protein
MPISAEDAKLLQEKILELCHATGRFGMPEAKMQRTLEDTQYLKRELIREGHGVDNEHLNRALKFLESEGLIEVEKERLRPDLRRWKTTSAGDKYLMEKGLI